MDLRPECAGPLSPLSPWIAVVFVLELQELLGQPQAVLQGVEDRLGCFGDDLSCMTIAQ